MGTSKPSAPMLPGGASTDTTTLGGQRRHEEKFAHVLEFASCLPELRAPPGRLP